MGLTVSSSDDNDHNNTSLLKNIKVYVAGGWPRRAEVGAVVESLREEGVQITSDWHCREGGSAPDEKAGCAQLDFMQMDQADVVLVVMDDAKYAYRGTFTEIGYACGRDKPVIIFCPWHQQVLEMDSDNVSYPAYAQTNVFYWLDEITHTSSVENVTGLIVKVVVEKKNQEKK